MTEILDLTLKRELSLRRVTHGAIYDEDGQWVCFALEDVVREKRGVPVREWKIAGETAIPEGRYRVTLERSPRFGENTITINDVPGFSYIRIHAGNDHTDTDGCPLVGLRRVVDPIGSGGSVLDSRLALSRLKERVTPTLAAGGEVWLTIFNP